MSTWLRLRCIGDRVAALAIAVVVSPVIAVCAVLVRRHDGGPPIIGVERVGRGERVFRMWKVRSMRADGPSGLASGLTLSGTGDDRITPIGRRLRSYYLDELPQLWNVVCGDMALLGPRPESPDFVDPVDPLWRNVLAVPPGIAGPTQVIVGDWEREVIASDGDGTAYRSEVLPVKLAIDAWYIRSSSPFTDALVAVTLARRLLPWADSSALEQRIFAAVPESRVVRDWLEGKDRVTPGDPVNAASVDASAESPPAPESQPVRTMPCA